MPTIVVLVAVMLTLAACGGGNDEPAKTTSTAAGSTSTAPASDSAAALVPESVRSQGEIRIATNAELPPWQYLDDARDYAGLEVELDRAIAERLGLPVRFSNIAFEAIIPGIQAQRYDLGSATITDTREREQIVDFVDFYRKVNVLLVAGGNPEGIRTLEDMCGKVAAAQAGTDWAQLFERQNAACEKAGKPGVELKQFPQLTDTVLAVQSGRAAATIEDYVAASDAASKKGMEVLTEKQYTPSMYGFAFPKNSELLPAWQAGFKEIIADGTYKDIFGRLNIDVGLVDDAQMNGALG